MDKKETTNSSRRPFPWSVSARQAPTARHYRWLASALVALAIYGNLLPFYFSPKPWEAALNAFREIALDDPANLDWRGDWVISTGLFGAVSYFLMAALCVDKSRLWSYTMALVVIPGCVALSALIEFLQIYFP